MKILDPCDRCGATHRLGVPCGPIMQGQIERLRAALAEKDKEVATLCQEAIRLQAAVVKAADRIAWLETHTDAALRSENERLDADIERSAESRNRLIDDYEAALKKAEEERDDWYERVCELERAQRNAATRGEKENP